MITAVVLSLSLLAPADTTIKRGAAVPARPPVAAAEVSADPARFGADTIVVEGMVEKVCQEMGCWLALTGAPGSRAVRITTHAQNFFVPFNAAGMQARAVGVVKVRKLTKTEADHMAEEGVTLVRKADGGAEEILFAATGVELRPAN